MATLATFEKQPADTQDYDIDFTEWLAGLSDTAASHTAVTTSGITLLSTSRTAGVVKVWLKEGLTGKSYKITVTLTTAGGRVKQAEITVKVKEL